MVLISALYSLYPVWYVMYKPGGVILDSVLKALDFGILNIYGTIFVLGIFGTVGVVMVGPGRGRSMVTA